MNANLDEIAHQYAGAEAAIEATSNYSTVYDTLNEYLDVVVADPNQTKALGVVEGKNDRLDAKLRAASLGGDDPPELRSAQGDQRAPRARARPETTGREQTDFKDQVHAILDQQGISYEWDPFSQEGREILAARISRWERSLEG